MGETSSGRFVVVSGLPGSGKSTVARAIAPLIDLPLLDKDDILDRLFAIRGRGDARWRRQLSRESDAILEAEVVRSGGAVAASFWHVPGMAPDSGTPTEWLANLPGPLVNVHCTCPPEIAAERFTRRQRDPGHLDGTRDPVEILASMRALVPFGPLRVGERVVIDTTEPVIATALLEDVQAAFARCRTRRAGDAGPSRS